MKTKTTSKLILFVALLFLVQIFSSCNSLEITKRRYNKGFYIDLGVSDAKKTEKKQDIKSISNLNENLIPIALEQEKTIENFVVNENAKEVFLSSLSSSTKNIISNKITRRIVNKAAAAAINYSANKKVNNDLSASITKSTNKTFDAKTTKHSNSGGKSQVIALLLVILVGGIGIHRFYLGYTWQGIVQLLTLGGCGVWALIDLIRIITGDLKPKDGNYDQTL